MTAIGALAFLFAWTIGTVVLASLVGLAMRHTHVVYLPDEDETVVKKTGYVEKCAWQRLYGIGLLVTGVGLIVSHSLIDDDTVRNISLGWGIVITLLGTGLWLAFSLGHRFK